MPSLIDRVRQQLGLGTVDPNVPADQVAPSLWAKIQKRVRDIFGRPPSDTQAPTVMDDASKRLLLLEAGARRVLVLLSYETTGHVFRHCEYYSFRPNSKTGLMDAMLFCRLHSEIHRMYVSRIENLVLTDEPFAPRWEIEL